MKNFVAVFLPVAIIVLLLAFIGARQKQSSTAPANTIKKEKVTNLARAQKRLGPEWKMIKLSKKKWRGPFRIRNGSGWKIAEGEIWVKIDNKPPFRDAPGKHHSVGGNKIQFSAYTGKAVIFFKY